MLGGTTTTYSINSAQLNQYSSVGSASLTYDTRGNLTADGTRTLAYDSDNRLTQVVVGGTTVGYTYDFAHRLAKRTVGSASARYIYDQDWNIIADLDGANGNTTAIYLYGPSTDEVVAPVHDGGANVRYLLKDNLGSTIAIFNNGGSIIERYTYDEYGAVQVRDSAGNPVGSAPFTRYLFTGREYDATVGLYHCRNRWYHPGFGRFVSVDPIGLEGGDTNLNSYLGNTPLIATDPFGLITPHEKGVQYWPSAKR